MQLHGTATGTILATPEKPRAPGMFATARNVVKAEGVGGIYSGLSASMLRQAMFIGTKFAAYDVFKRTAAGPGGDAADLGFHQKVGCGLGAGLVGALVGNPADLAMVRMQADGRLPPAERRNYRNGGQALVHIARSEGITTLWRGCAPTINRAMIVTASQMAIYDQTKQEIKKRSGMEEGLGLHTASSLVAGFVAAITSNPFDVAKTRLMNMSADRATGQMPFKGTFDCMLKSVRSDGLGALYKGLNATIVRQVPLNMVRFTAMEQLKIMLKIA